MQTVDVLRDDRAHLALSLELGQLEVRLVGLGVERDHLGAVEVVELLGVRHVEAVGEHRLGWIGEALVVQPVYAAEIRNAARGGHPGAAEEHHVVRAVDELFQPSCCLLRIGDGGGHGALLACAVGGIDAVADVVGRCQCARGSAARALAPIIGRCGRVG